MKTAMHARLIRKKKRVGKMATDESDPSGLEEIRLCPEEKKYSPFNIFSEKIPDAIITGCEEVHFPPFNALTNDSTTISYQVPPFSRKMVKLNSARLFGSARILEIQENGTLAAPADTVDISVINNLPASMFNRVSVRFNNLDLDQGGAQSYSYKVSIIFRKTKMIGD